MTTKITAEKERLDTVMKASLGISRLAHIIDCIIKTDEPLTDDNRSQLRMLTAAISHAAAVQRGQLNHYSSDGYEMRKAAASQYVGPNIKTPESIAAEDARREGEEKETEAFRDFLKAQNAQ